MLGLRTVWGVSLESLLKTYSYKLSERQMQWLKKQRKEGFVQPGESVIRLTEKGLKIADYLILELISRH